MYFTLIPLAAVIRVAFILNLTDTSGDVISSVTDCIETTHLERTRVSALSLDAGFIIWTCSISGTAN
jgi:hypothetical protein